MPREEKKMKISLKKAAVAAMVLAAGTGCFAAGKKWNKKEAISVISREEGSGTRGAFIELFGIEKKNAQGKKVDFTTDEAAITNSTAVMMTTVSQNRYAIGYISLGSLNSSVKALNVDGAVATVANISNGTYKIARPFNVATKENISEAAKDFLGFIMSDDGQGVIEKNKYIRVSGGAYTSSGVSGKVVVSGSSSVSPVMEKLIEAYRGVNPNVRIELQTSDSTTGVANASSGTCDIGLASRELKASETSKGVKGTVIAMDGIAVIVNNANPLSDISSGMVEKIFTGETEKWKDIVK